MKTVEEMIERVRRQTRNATTGSTTAGASIDDAEFVDQLNDGQELCAELISGVYSTLFERVKTYTIDTSADDYEILTLPDYLLLGTRICLVEYSYSGNVNDYINIPSVDVRERYTGSSYLRTLMGYILTGNRIILSEIPNNNGAKVRVTYELALPRLDVVKATLATGSRSGTDYSGTYTTGTAHADVAAYWNVGDKVTVLDSTDNTVLIRDGEFSALDTGAGSFTIDLTDATYTAATVDAATATNLRLIEGGRTNFCELPDACEKFLTAYATMEIFARDGSKLTKQAKEKFERIERSLQQSYLTATKDWPMVPEADY